MMIETQDTTPRRYGDTKSIVLIGGGDLMLHTAIVARNSGFTVTVVLAPRHAKETLPVAGTLTGATFKKNGFPSMVMENINEVADLSGFYWTGDDALGLCFGPAWVFSDAVRVCFGRGMMNYHPVPVPKFLGGAHYTWQIMHGDRNGACVLQEITQAVNAGPILRRHTFPYSDGARIPQDYFDENDRAGREFFDQVVRDIRDDVAFPLSLLDDLADDREYYPRLHTARNAYIDWTWTVAEIAQFCDAFAAPYEGAASFLNGAEIRLSDVNVSEKRPDMHPFGAGVIIRRRQNAAWVSAAGGILKVGCARFDDGTDAMGYIKEGSRLLTPWSVLEEATTFSPIITGDGITNG